MAKAEHNATPDPHWVRDTLIEDYRETARKRGVEPALADLETVVMGDLANYEAVTREQRKAAPRRKEQPAPSAVGAPAKALADETGWQVAKRPLPDKPPRKRFASFLDQKPENAKQAAAIMRLGQVLQPKSWFRPSQTMDYTVPRLAQRFVETMQELDRGMGEFEGKSAEDARRIVWRRVEDICDQSTGALGPWWVK